MKNGLKKILSLSGIFVLLLIGFLYVPRYELSENSLIGIAFLIGIVCTGLFAYFIFGQKLFAKNKSTTTNDFSNPFIEFAKRAIVILVGVSIITLLSIQYLLRKPVIDFADGQPTMAKIHSIDAIRTHRGLKYQINVNYLIEEDTVSTFEIIFKEELKFIEQLDSVPIVYSRSNPDKISIITTDSKLEKIKTGGTY